MNSIQDSLRSFLHLILIVDITSKWYLEDLVNEIFRDFLMSGEITNRRLHLLVSRSLVELFGTEVKRSQRNKVFFTIKLNIDLTGTMDIFPSITRRYTVKNDKEMGGLIIKH